MSEILCQFSHNCGGYCETDEEIEMDLCCDCLDAGRQRDEDQSALVAALNLIADIRIAAGDPEGKMMQDELVKYIAVLYDRATDGYTSGELLAEAGIK